MSRYFIMMELMDQVNIIDLIIFLIILNIVLTFYLIHMDSCPFCFYTFRNIQPCKEFFLQNYLDLFLDHSLYNTLQFLHY